MYAVTGIKINNELINDAREISISNYWLIGVGTEDIIKSDMDSKKTIIVSDIENFDEDLELNVEEFNDLLDKQEIFGWSLIFPKDKLAFFMNKFDIDTSDYISGLHRLCWSPEDIERIERVNDKICITHKYVYLAARLKSEVDTKVIRDEIETQVMLWRMME